MFWCFLGLVGFASGQLTVPAKGWKLVEKGDGRKEGKRTLGVWQNEEKTIIIGAAWDVAIPETKVLFDLPELDENVAGADPPPHWPKWAEKVAEPLVGLKIGFETIGKGDPGEREHYWVFGEEGGVFLKVFVKKGAKFDLKKWAFGKPLPGDLVAKKEKVKRAIQVIEGIKVPPAIKIDPDLKPAGIGQQKENPANKIIVVIRKNGAFEMKGRELGIQGLKTVLKDRFRKIGADAVLHIRADTGVQFKYVQRVIKAGAQVGLKKVAYAAFVPDEGNDEE